MKTNIPPYYTFAVGTKLNRGKIIPVFLPFAGCPFKCLYCAQDTQTGAGEITISQALKGLEQNIKALLESTFYSKKNKIEIAFYGGTFTALSDEDFNACITTFSTQKKQLIEAGYNVFGRCSTRPDCLSDTTRLLRMKELGIDLIELGIQSFNDNVLAGLGRAYTGEIAKNACDYLQKMGFYLGIQLMPSSPMKDTSLKLASQAILYESKSEKKIKGEPLNKHISGTQDISIFFEDVRIALSFTPACLRYYPCLVLENTGLASLWKQGKFLPWDLETCVDSLGYALSLAWEKEIPVIRLSVAFEENFEKQVLAGVRHPSLGGLIKARALRYAFMRAQLEFSRYFQEQFQQKKRTLTNLRTISKNNNSQTAMLTRSEKGEIQLSLPKNVQGFIFGEKNALKKEWEKDIILENIFYREEE